MFATTGGTVRRNKLSDFVDVQPLRQDRHEARRGRGHRRRRDLHRGRRRAADHRAAASASASRSPEVRVFEGREFDRRARHQSRRGRHASSRWRSSAISRRRRPSARAYLKMSRAVRGEGEPEEPSGRRPRRTSEASGVGGELSQERYAEMSAAEQFILTVSENGYGKRTSSLRVPGHRRGGKGIVAMVGQRAERPAGRLLPGRDERPDHAGHRRRPDRSACRSTSIRIAGRAHAGRDRVRHGRGREGRLGRAHLGGRRRGRRTATARRPDGPTPNRSPHEGEIADQS